MVQKFAVLGGLKRENMKDESRHPVQRMRQYSKKCVLQSLAKKYKKERKKPFLNIIFYPFAPPTLLGHFGT